MTIPLTKYYCMAWKSCFQLGGKLSNPYNGSHLVSFGTMNILTNPPPPNSSTSPTLANVSKLGHWCNIKWFNFGKFWNNGNCISLGQSLRSKCFKTLGNAWTQTRYLQPCIRDPTRACKYSKHLGIIVTNKWFDMLKTWSNFKFPTIERSTSNCDNFLGWKFSIHEDCAWPLVMFVI